MATDGLDDDSTPPSRLVRLLYAIPYLLILYVLSVGPMYWKICEAYHLEGSRLVYVLYYPLVRAAEINYISNFLDCYIELWI